MPRGCAAWVVVKLQWIVSPQSEHDSDRRDDQKQDQREQHVGYCPTDRQSHDHQPNKNRARERRPSKAHDGDDGGHSPYGDGGSPSPTQPKYNESDDECKQREPNGGKLPEDAMRRIPINLKHGQSSSKLATYRALASALAEALSDFSSRQLPTTRASMSVLRKHR